MKIPATLSFAATTTRFAATATHLAAAATRFAAAALLLATTTLIPSTAINAQSPNPLYQHLPPTANHIYSVRLSQIVAKGELLSLLNAMPAPKDAHGAMAVNVIKDPASAGIDLSHEILIAQTTASGEGTDNVSYTQILVPLTDSAKFRTTFTKIANDIHTHKVPGKGTTALKDKMGMAWNDQLLVITMAAHEASAGTGSAPMHKPGTAPSHPAPAAHRSLAELALEKSLTALTGFTGTPWLTDQRFLTGFSSDEDMHAWSIRMDFMSMIAKFSKKMAAKSPMAPHAAMPDYSKMDQMPHPPVLSTFNFENGRILFRMTTFNKPEDADLFRRVYDRPVNKDLLARVPAGLLLGCAAVHFNAAALPDIWDKFHTRQMMDSVLGKKGLSVTDISGIFGGDFLIAALGDTTATTDTTKKKVNFYFVATLGDPSKLMQVAAKLGASIGSTPDTAQMAKMKKLAGKMVIQDNTLVISGSREAAQKYFTNPDRRSTALLDNDNSLMDIVVDLKAASSVMGAGMGKDPKALIAARILEKLDKIELHGGMLDGNNMVMTFQITTGDPSTNSLKTLVGLLH